MQVCEKPLVWVESLWGNSYVNDTYCGNQRMKSSAVTATVIASGVGGLNAIADAVRTTDALATSLNIVGQQARPILNELSLIHI